MSITVMSWNIDGLDKDKWDYIKRNYLVDVLFLQETKRDAHALSELFKDVKDQYNWIINSHSPSLYHGVAVLIKKEIKYEQVDFKLGCKARDDTKKGNGPECGRVICIKIGEVLIINTYVPYSGTHLQRLHYRTEEWDKHLFNKLNTLSKVIWLGDINVAPENIDVSHPKTLCKRSGFTNQERQSLADFLKTGWTDVWRQQHPGIRKYSFRGYNNYRYRWRLDNCIVSNNALSHVTRAFIVNESECLANTDHLPIGIVLST